MAPPRIPRATARRTGDAPTPRAIAGPNGVGAGPAAVGPRAGTTSGTGGPIPGGPIPPSARGRGGGGGNGGARRAPFALRLLPGGGGIDGALPTAFARPRFGAPVGTNGLRAITGQ